MWKIFFYTLLILTLFIFYVTNSLIDEPYMDEIFHFPQAAKYYNGIYNEWDTKITTPPGLYLVTILLLNPLSLITGLDLCKIGCFRLINIHFTIGTFYLLYKIIKHLHKDTEERYVLLSSFNICFFPLLYFFNFLYYTDCGSTFFVLLLYHCHLQKKYFSAAAAGAVSILFRQTNIVWVFCFAADETLHCLVNIFSEELTKKEKKITSVSLSEIKKVILSLWRTNKSRILTTVLLINAGYIPVAIGFVLFVAYNGSIVLGDKSAHQACIHIPQLFYFSLFVSLFASPFLISLRQTKNFTRFVACHKTLTLFISLICIFCIIFMSHTHPYLLADNRHHSFYIWKRILRRNILTACALVPVYLFSVWLICSAVRHKSILFKLTLAFCVIVLVVPQKLFEMRYFIVPYVILRIQMKVVSKWQPFLEFLLYGAVNFLVLYLFLFEKLPWNSVGKGVRIMW